MTRGQLRVYLGSAPGVGKTYHMLDEGWRRRNRGTDVVIGYVETHQRPSTDALIRDLEVIPRVTREYRGAFLEEMDLEAVLARKPQVALVDELAHTNVPGGEHEKRWQDVEVLLEAGIDVITTVNIQHLESVNDVVEKITGITQQETVPDAVVRAAEQIELVDVTPEALRRRMAHGNIYAADKINASLSNYFRVGNLSALRELALLWLADRVEDALQRYQDDHEISATWETRERLIVGVTGSQTDEILLRRAARIASRTGAEMIAVHVVSADALQRAATDTSLAQELVAEFEGKFQEIVEDDIALALVAFAHAERGTQIVLGASRPRSALRPLGGVVRNVLRRSRDLDVHVIAVGGERPARVHRRRQSFRFSRQRQIVALVLTAAIMPLVTVLLVEARSSLSLSTEFLAYLVVVLALTTWGGIAVGVVATLAASALENYYFVPPLHTLEVARPDDVVSLVAFLLFAVGASVVVSKYARRSYEAEHARAEAQVLAKVVGAAGTSREDLLPLLDTLRTVFAASSVSIVVLRDGAWQPDVVSGEQLQDVVSATRFPIDDEYALVLEGATLNADDRQLVSAFAERVAVGLRVVSNAQEAVELRAMAEAEVTRSSMVRAVSADLRGSLSNIQFRVTSLLDGGVAAPAKVKHEWLVVIESEVQRMTRLVDDLIDVGRLETGDVTPRFAPASLADLLKRALSTIDAGGRTLDIDLTDDLPVFVTDAELVARTLAIVVGNACRFAPVDRPVRITAGVTGDKLELLVIDRGPGIDRSRRAALLEPAPRRGDANGADLGLSVASGFVKLLGGKLRFEDTPSGGLTVILEFPLQRKG
jgi:two-component system sensor histidine kinase KdpD